MFTLKQGRTKYMDLPVTASTVLSARSLVSWDSGYLIAATSSTAPSNHVGILLKAITASDSDYATARFVSVEVPIENATVWEADVTSGLVVADRGLYQDLTDAVTVNRGSSSYDVVQCVGVISTTKGLFHLNLATSGIGNIVGA